MANAFAAYSMPLWPIDIPVQATTAQECQGPPLAATVADILMVGTIWLTSPTSVDPPCAGKVSRKG